jgi:hypothetical protein
MFGRATRHRDFQDATFDELGLGAEAAVRPMRLAGDPLHGMPDRDRRLVFSATAGGPPLKVSRANEAAPGHCGGTNTVARFGEPSRHAVALRAARQDGHDQGETKGFITGMHWGAGIGAIAGALLFYLLFWVAHLVWPGLRWFA